MSEDRKLYVAVFREHPLGGRRFAKDFQRNLTRDNIQWWGVATEEVRLQHFEWSLNHPQYHYSTDSLNKADVWRMDAYDKEDRDILEKYAPVDYIEVDYVHSEKDEHGWQTYWLEEVVCTA